jgi:hypothetical protein
MVINLGEYDRRGYIYLQEDDSRFSNVTLFYADKDGKVTTIMDEHYPFEFTIPLKGMEEGISFWFSAKNQQGGIETSEKYRL